MCNKLQLLLLLLCLLLANVEAQKQPQQQQQQQRLRLPQGYNMRLGSVPTRFVGKGAYTLAAKRASPLAKWQQQAQLPQQQQQQQQQRRQLFQWATMGGKKYNL